LAEAIPNVGDIVGSAKPAGIDCDHQKAATTSVIAASHHKVPIGMPPARDARLADYPGEAKSKYEIWQVEGAGRTRRAWQWRASSSPECSTGCPR
jgi:hypothetical protein